jgi:hypothetical protein
MVFPAAEVVLEEEVTATNDGLEALTIAELRAKGRVLSVVPACTDREKRRPEPWVTALRVARAAAAVAAAAAAAAVARAATERAKATVEAVHEAVCARPRVRTLNTANHDGWQRGERLDGRDAVQVAVQQRVAGADNADEATTTRLLCRGRRQRQTAKTATATGGGSRQRYEQQSGWCHSGRCWQQVEWVGTGV